MITVKQPVPDVNEADVLRVLHRDYPEATREAAVEQLARLGGSLSKLGLERISLAALKIAAGNLKQLTLSVDLALLDYRDCLMGAEYPHVANKMYAMDHLSRDEQKALVDADWGEYKQWLGRDDLAPIHR